MSRSDIESSPEVDTGVEKAWKTYAETGQVSETKKRVMIKLKRD